MNDQQQISSSSNSPETAAFCSLQNWRKSISTGMDQLLAGLFVGGLRDAMDSQQLADNGIKAIVSVHGLSKDCQFGPGIAVFRVMLNDASGENVARHFGPVNSFIHSHRLEHESVLVHCLAGVSRSVCLCVAYLMTVTNLDYPSALDFVCRRRFCAKPNFGFKMQLLKFGQQLVRVERQRLFAEFASSRAHEFGVLYRNDCIFTNSLFVRGAEQSLEFNGKSGAEEGSRPQQQEVAADEVKPTQIPFADDEE